MKKSKKLVVGTSLLAALLILPSAASAGFFFGGNQGQVKPAPVAKDPVAEDEVTPTPTSKRKASQSQPDEEIPVQARKKTARVQSDLQDEAPAPVRRKVAPGGVEHLGRVPAVIKGRVDAPCVEPCTLSSALSLIVPDGWNIYADNGIDMDELSSVKKDNWINSLRQAMASSHKIAKVDWDKHEVTITSPVLIDSKSQQAPIAARVFSLVASDKMLSVAIGRWCAESSGECRLLKWQSGMDVPLEAGAQFKAETSKDAILQLFASIEQTTGHAFALNTKYNNNVWIVTDKADGVTK